MEDNTETDGQDEEELGFDSTTPKPGPGPRRAKAAPGPKPKPQPELADSDSMPSKMFGLFNSIGSSAGKGFKGKSALKEIGKSDAVCTESGQFLQDFDDAQGVFTLAEKKLDDLLSKVKGWEGAFPTRKPKLAGRFKPPILRHTHTFAATWLPGRLDQEVVAACVAQELDGDLQQRGLKIVNLLRTLKGKLLAVVPLVQSLSSTEGERFQHSFLRSALAAAREAGVAVTNAVDEVLAVREVTMLAEAMEWDRFVHVLQTGLTALSPESAKQLRWHACVHAVESIMRPPLGQPSAQEDEAQEVRLTRCKRVQAFHFSDRMGMMRPCNR